MNVAANELLLNGLKSHQLLQTLPDSILKKMTMQIQLSIRDQIIAELGINRDLLADHQDVYWRLHSTKLNEIMVNLTTEDVLGNQLYNNPHMAEKVGSMNYRDYNPEPTQQQFDIYQKLIKDISNVTSKQESELYMCSKCNSPMYVREMSDRAADEQQKVELKCKTCGNHAII